MSEQSTKDHTLNLDSAEQSLWLVKVPNFVADSWALASNDESLGTFAASRIRGPDPSQPPKEEIVIKLKGVDGAPAIPLDYTLEPVLSKDTTSATLAFSFDSEEKGFAANGKIIKNWLLRPQNTPAYRNLIKERSLRMNERTEAKPLVESSSSSVRPTAGSQTVEFFRSTKGEMKRKRNLSMGENSDIGAAALKSRMFDAFAKNERIPFKELLGQCADTTSHTKELQELLEKYGKFNKKGTFKNLWELKPEYKDHSGAGGDGGGAF